jgi:hypothetical protein
MKRLFSITLALVGAVLAGCILPTPVCGCSPPPMPGTINAIVLDDQGAPVPAASVLVARGTVDSCEPTTPAEQRTVPTRSDGTVALQENEFAPWACLRLQGLPRSSSLLRPSDVVTVRFVSMAARQDLVRLRLQAPL